VHVLTGVKLGLSYYGVFEITVPWRIFGLKRDEVSGDWRITQQGALFCAVLTIYYSGGIFILNGSLLFR
jgi:hypothetical protein